LKACSKPAGILTGKKGIPMLFSAFSFSGECLVS